MPISSQAFTKEGPETISEESRPQAGSKRRAPRWGDDIVRTSWKREAALKKLVTNLKISKTGCWEWTGSKTTGYGSMKLPDIYGNFKILAHRLSWVAFKGEVIPEGIFVCHHCDNPKCFNPDHLFLGTQQENLQDCSAKNRTMTGSLNGNSKYSDADIEKVQELIAQKKRGIEISAITGVSQSHISRIRKGYTWKHKTASAADMINANRKFSDEQIMSAVRLIKEGKLTAPAISKITGVSIDTVKDIRRGRAYQRFVERVAE
ncbi:MAG: HNH endonuclease signature motif containing protein [Dehalococcoidales bacterium]